MQTKIHTISSDAMEEFKQISNTTELENWFKKFLGKNGLISDLNKQLKDMNAEEKAVQGQLIQSVKKDLMEMYETKKQSLESETAIKQYDFTAYKQKIFGVMHPLTKIKKDIMEVFMQEGFQIESGPEIETSYYNFDALNTAAEHPSRSLRDTFYLTEDILLRTHTTSMQARILEKSGKDSVLPIKSIVYGNVYRRDDDATHTPMFTQLEGIIVAENLTVHHLKSWILGFLKKLLPIEDIRFRPSFFPFTYCSAEVDIKLKNSNNWLELLGCGMIHPRILSNVNIDNNRYQGLAFGLGVERLAMIKYGIKDLRELYRNNIQFLENQ